MPRTTGSRSSKNPRSGGSKSSKSSRSSRSGKPKLSGEEEDLVDVYCAVYNPHFGNYYHWAFALHRRTTRGWLLCEVVQDEQDGPFRRVSRQANPTNSSRCLQPLLGLVTIDAQWLLTLSSAIEEIPVPGEGLSWNCQDYVLEIWEVMYNNEIITTEIWQAGHDSMLEYYGQDFGGGHEENEEEAEYEEPGDGEEAQGRQPLSAELIYDSDSH